MRFGRSVRVSIEQAVYGSFAFWNRGYALLAQSEGCKPEWLAAFREACARYGERPHTAMVQDALFALRMKSGGWMVVGVGDSGADDRGRPGALCFHALFVNDRAYRRAGGAPFPFEPYLRRQWGPETQALRSETLTLDRFGSESEIGRDDKDTAPAEESARAVAIAGALRCRRRVALESAEPIDALARAVWCRLPPHARRRCSIATWAFGNQNRFDFLGVPRLAESMVDRSYVDPESLMRPEGWPTPTERLGRTLDRMVRGAGRGLAQLGRVALARLRKRDA